MTLKVLVCGEGDHDMGKRAWDQRALEHVEMDGCVQIFCRRLLPELHINFERKHRQTLIEMPRPLRRRSAIELVGHARKAAAAKAAAESDGFDAIVFMADADSKDGFVWLSKVKEVMDGFDAIPGRSIGIACVPKPSLEAWLFADARVWGARRVTSTVIPTDPENSWGHRRDAVGGHPKQVFARLCSAAGLSNSSETRWMVARETDLVELEKVCRMSFVPFAESVRHMAESRT